jgi:hypothetical protein
MWPCCRPPNKRLLQAAYFRRFRFDAGTSPALFPFWGSGPIVSSLAFNAAAEAHVVGRFEPTQSLRALEALTQSEQ